MLKHRFGARLALMVAAIATTSALIGAAPALAVTETHTVSVVVGPVVAPFGLVNFCIDLTCESVPPAALVFADLSITESITTPTITRGSCPAGQTGQVLTIATGSDSIILSGVVVAVVDGVAEVLPLGLPIPVAVNHTVVVSLCTT